MLSILPHKIRFAARLMLLLSLLQSVITTAETAGWFHGDDQFSHHHDADTNGLNTDRPAADDHSLYTQADTCDHCCHCHGHSMHLPVMLNTTTLAAVPVRLRSLSTDRDHAYSFIHSIHRPPIA